MLSRTAGNLFWLGRYVERAENVARLLSVGLRMAALSPSEEQDGTEWHSTLVASGCQASFYAKHPKATAELVIDHLVRDADNPSSIRSCIETARRNARAVRTALTADMWDAVNSAWLEGRALTAEDFQLARVQRVLDWVRERSLLFLGASGGTMLRSDAYWFARLGTFVERADNTARILDVKYEVLLPSYEQVGGTVDYYQWTAVLRSVSALRAYHYLYRDRIKPWRIAELLLLRPEMPRSLITCTNEIAEQLGRLEAAYGSRGPCHEEAERLQARLRDTTIDAIFAQGLHEFLTESIEANMRLGHKVAEQYLF